MHTSSFHISWHQHAILPSFFFIISNSIHYNFILILKYSTVDSFQFVNFQNLNFNSYACLGRTTAIVAMAAGFEFSLGRIGITDGSFRDAVTCYLFGWIRCRIMALDKCTASLCSALVSESKIYSWRWTFYCMTCDI